MLQDRITKIFILSAVAASPLYLIKLNSDQCQINDISVLGCFAVKPLPNYDLGQIVNIEIILDSNILNFSGIIVRETDSGYGIRFINLKKEQKKLIKYFFDTKYPLRYKIKIGAKIESENKIFTPLSGGRIALSGV